MTYMNYIDKNIKTKEENDRAELLFANKIMSML